MDVIAQGAGDQYTRVRELGSGTFGVVYEAIRKSDSLRVAIKRSKPLERETGIAFTALREVKYLQSLKCTNIVNIIEVFLTGESLYMVLEYCPFDLVDLIYDKRIFLRTEHVKCCLQMILRGVLQCHKNHVLHRDLKPANVLYSPGGQLRLADFGAARSHASPRDMTNEVVTLPYRAPELLFGATFYSAAVDMWAVGCIFAELMLREALFPGASEVDQLSKIFNILGTPTDLLWPDAKLLGAYIEFEPREAMSLESIFSAAQPGEGGVDLLLQMLVLDPRKRISAEEALAHAYFSAAPLAVDSCPLPSTKARRE